MTLPSCGSCGGRLWVATYRVQLERVWSTSALDPTAHLEREDEDHGEWEVPTCQACGEYAAAEFHDVIFEALTTA